MADFDVIYEEEEETEENVEDDNIVSLVADPVVVRGTGNMTVWVFDKMLFQFLMTVCFSCGIASTVNVLRVSVNSCHV